MLAATQAAGLLHRLLCRAGATGVRGFVGSKLLAAPLLPSECTPIPCCPHLPNPRCWRRP